MTRTFVPNRIFAAAIAGVLVLSIAPRPAAADGAASTRNIIFGAAAATAGTLLIINHNRKVHEKYAEYDREQAATQAQANQSQAAYESERQAYDHEANIVSEYKKESDYQHAQVKRQAAEIAALKHSLVLAKSGARPHADLVRQASSQPAARGPVAAATYGWGQF